MPIVSEAKFNTYQKAFFSKVSESDMIIQIGIETVPAPSTEFLESFTGSNERTVTWYDFPVLYNSEIAFFQRAKVQLQEHEDGEIYLSPLQLIEQFGDWKIDERATLVRKNNGTEMHEFIIAKVEYLEPIYESCIAIKLSLREKIEG